MSRIRVVVHGALGKMGQEVIKAVNQDPETELTGVVDQHLSKDSGEILYHSSGQSTGNL